MKRLCSTKSKRWALLIAAAAVVAIGVVAGWLFQEVEYARVNSPRGGHIAIVTYRRYEAFKSTAPGQSGDKAGFISIEDTSGVRYGKIAVPMVWMFRELVWTEEGAKLPLIGKWTFLKKEYRYWDDDQTEETVKQAE
jgi:hypothetical protein